MIENVTGDLFESNAEALVNTVNTVGIMGKGIALQFKKTFPENNKAYIKACKNGTLKIGTLLITKEKALHTGEKIIINFPTKTDWRKPSEYSYIESGLDALKKALTDQHIKSIAIPPLGAGNGGLNWNKVKSLIEDRLSDVDCDIYLYEPNFVIQEALNKERVKLTPARAMLLAVLFDLVKNGEFVSEFAAEKIAYFLQRFGAKDVFNLDFQPNFYGPYSGKVKHVLYYLNGSYISGYSSKDKRAFEELGIIASAENDINAYLDEPENITYKEIVKKTTTFLSGYYSAFALELLSTIDYIIHIEKAGSLEAIQTRLNSWSDRKKTLFSNTIFIEKAYQNLQANHLV